MERVLIFDLSHPFHRRHSLDPWRISDALDRQVCVALLTLTNGHGAEEREFVCGMRNLCLGNETGSRARRKTRSSQVQPGLSRRGWPTAPVASEAIGVIWEERGAL